MAEKLENIILGAGCFWCTDAAFATLKGVIMVAPGYAGGKTANPTYEQVSSGKTGHAEVTKVTYDANIINLNTILDVFFAVHDPTTLNRQGNDVGTQYRSMIIYFNDGQKKTAEDYIKKLTKEKIFNRPIVTELKPFENFYEAEDYHKNYYEKNAHKPYCQMVIAPKLIKMKEKFSKIMK